MNYCYRVTTVVYGSNVAFPARTITQKPTFCAGVTHQLACEMPPHENRNARVCDGNCERIDEIMSMNVNVHHV
jgi:hypothetical protein